MKKMLAAYCCILFFQSFAQVPQPEEQAVDKSSGKKVLIKAIALIVNAESNKKAPVRKIFIPSSECPLPSVQVRPYLPALTAWFGWRLKPALCTIVFPAAVSKLISTHPVYTPPDFMIWIGIYWCAAFFQSPTHTGGAELLMICCARITVEALYQLYPEKLPKGIRLL